MENREAQSMAALIKGDTIKFELTFKNKFLHPLFSQARLPQVPR